MKARRLVMVLTFALVVGGFGASRGLAHMQQTYDGACGQLVGFPGLLQKMNFFAIGNCRLKNSGDPNTCQANGACTVTSSSGNVAGKCRSMPSGCTCVPN